jgi:hypothetical protein
MHACCHRLVIISFQLSLSIFGVKSGQDVRSKKGGGGDTTAASHAPRKQRDGAHRAGESYTACKSKRVPA